MSSDIDIDLPSNVKIEKLFPTWVKASIKTAGELSPHPCGWYPQQIGCDPITGLSAAPYDMAEEIGYTKIDFLHLHVYEKLASRIELEQMVMKEPDWGLLRLPTVVAKLFQLSNHYKLLDELRPTSVEELADIMALIRPGKSNLIEIYKINKALARRTLWAKGKEGYTFKKSHAAAYAMVVVVQLHLATEKRL